MIPAFTAVHLYRANRHDPTSPYLVQKRLARAAAPTAETLTIRTGPAEDLVTQLKRLRLTPTPTLLQGYDGTAFKLRLGEELGNVRLSWWQDLPTEWETLREPLRILERLAKLKHRYYD
jgi:hypothetical protein